MHAVLLEFPNWSFHKSTIPSPSQFVVVYFGALSSLSIIVGESWARRESIQQLRPTLKLGLEDGWIFLTSLTLYCVHSY